MTDTVDPPACLWCGQPVSSAVATTAGSHQFAVDRIVCPSCGASLAGEVEGHADRGWRLDGEPGG